MGRRAVVLFSGGLDSCLAAAVLRAQGVTPLGFHLASVFARSDPAGQPAAPVREAAEALGLALHAEPFTRELLGLVRANEHGFGKHRNPCIDCRIACIRRAEAHRRRVGADFLASGEVLGQRPMSQNRNAMERIDRATGLGDLLLRPLSAAHLEPTLPEREGWVDRDRLPAIQGRSRQEQIALAEELGVTRYAAPAGGCLLTEAGFCAKLDDLLAHHPGADAEEMELLRVGRHFRAGPSARAVSGRDEAENGRLEALARPGDLLFQAVPERGSLVLLRRDPVRPNANPNALTAGESDAINAEGAIDEADPVEATAAGLAVHYSRRRLEGTADVEVRACGAPQGAGAIRPGRAAVDPATLRREGEG